MSTEDAILTVVTKPPGVQVASRWRLEREPMVLGRHPSCEIHLPDRQVSREHARIFRTSTGFFIEDLASKNGTYVNGEPVRDPTPLRDGDVIQIGLAFRLAFVGAEGTVPLPPDARKSFALRLDPEKKAVSIGGKALYPPLSPAQFDLLELLVNAQGRIIERDEIAETIWGSREGVTEQAIDALVRRLRRRLEEVDPSKEYIVTVRGYGFRLEV
ncbi:MAG: FHA domain-containing protein [Chloroflexota bacterium]|nr:FHA domain-containing protein [Chloroflexota bacterium]